MLDTVAFNSVLDGMVPLVALTGLRLFATHIQRDEINATPDEQRRDDLLAVFHAVDAIELPTETAVWGISKWGMAKWGVKNGVYESLLRRIKELDRKNRPANQARDALIAETAIKIGLILVTGDSHLAQAVREFGGRVDDVHIFDGST